MRHPYVATVLLLVFSLPGCQVGGCCDARPSARQAQCKENLRTIYGALMKYVSFHGDVPRDKEGKASMVPLDDPSIQKELGIDSSTLRCPADEDPVGPSYLLNPVLSADDLGSDSTTIIACDRIPNHLGTLTQNSLTVVLLGNGFIVVMDLPLEEQGEWRQLFLSGDKRACNVSTRDGSKGHWTSSNIMWYIGEERGYVPNEGSDSM
jgi:hypothetical protein